MQSSDTLMAEAPVGGPSVDATAPPSETDNDATQEKTISFAEIIKGRNASVKVTDDEMVHAVELVMLVHGATRVYAAQVIRDLDEDAFPCSNFVVRKMRGTGNGRTKLLTFRHAIQLIMVLPGKMAREMRTKFADIIERYAAGTKSLIAEIEANARSSDPIAQMARKSVASRGAADGESLDFLNTRLQLARSISTAVDQGALKLKVFSQEYNKLKNDEDLLKTAKVIDDIITKVPLMKVAAKTYVESKVKMIEVDTKQYDLNSKQYDLDSKRIEVQKQLNEQEAKRLELEKQGLEFADLKRKRAQEVETETLKKQQKVDEDDEIITVRDVADELYSSLFAGIVVTDKEYATIVKIAGGRCASEYKKAKLEILPRVKHGDYHVAAYKRKHKKFVIDALKCAVNKYKALPGKHTQQNTLDSMWTRG